MEFMKLIGTVLAVCFHPCCASSAFADHRICRRGTEKPCYKITSFQDSRLRASFEAARQKCREDDGELLSIETENEQRLVERFVQELRASDGDFWIGLRRSPRYNADCSSQYYWLDYSQATFRNWLVTEPSCGLDQCVALFYKPSSSAGQKEHNLFKWTDYNCNSKNNFICKYSDEKHPVPTPAGNITTLTGTDDLTLVPKQPPITVDNDRIKTELSESSVSISDDTNIYYILLATLPVMLLLILVVSGVFCFRVMSRRRKEQNEIYAVPGQWVRPVAPKSQNDYKHTNKFNQSGAHLEYMSSEINRTFSVTSTISQFEDYENVPSRPTQCGFVTNDIYETCRSSSVVEAGWVDNDIYGY
ncbi:layilin [Sinocyclocheilus anshuiensis]|uniref:C-type lectin domain-containing protein n=1 Tax=Sinocyclocheilus anshuiensis TaxID=1608454 RepID=A0A671R1D4_9TELE|nr:PREDICTED: layilin [Sinocyclocheilus anshuiensis]